jgi:alkylation response protein AidB-like acyl-CoA dehydrogenase
VTALGRAPALAKVISLADERVSIRGRLLRSRSREVGENAFARASDYDEDGAYPAEDVAALHESGLITAVLPVKSGGVGLSGVSLSEVLQSIGSGSLPLGRLFEGHVNALEFVPRYGSALPGKDEAAWPRRSAPLRFARRCRRNAKSLCCLCRSATRLRRSRRHRSG